MAYVEHRPFAGMDLLTDDTLPPDHIKFLHGDDLATVFRLDLGHKTSEAVATWPERAPRRSRPSSE